MPSPVCLPTQTHICVDQQASHPLCYARHWDYSLVSSKLHFPALLSYLAMVYLVPIDSLVKLRYPKYCSHQELSSFSKEDRKRQKYLFEKARREGTLEGRHQSSTAIRPQKDKKVVLAVISRHLLLSHRCIAPATGMQTRACIFQHYSPKSQGGITTRRTNKE